MISVNVRLILAIPLYLLGAIVAISATITELGTLYGIITLDLRLVIQCIVGGAILAVIAAISFAIGGAIHGERSDAS